MSSFQHCGIVGNSAKDRSLLHPGLQDLFATGEPVEDEVVSRE